MFNTLDRELSIRSVDNDKKIKYVSVDKQNFGETYSRGNKMYQNYNTEIENDLIYGLDTKKHTTKNNKNGQNIINLVNNDGKLKLGQEKVNLNAFPKTAAKVPKESEEYWDNTRRKNLDTAIYTNNPSKIGGRGFGDIGNYDLFLNGIGTSTRQENPDIKPQNVDNDRIYLSNHNYNNEKFRVTENLQCGADTRYLNKKMM